MKDCYTTKRLLLRPASISMAAALADYYRRNEAFLRPFEPQREPAFYTEAFQRSILE